MHGSRLGILVMVAALSAPACRGDLSAPEPGLKFWHTFDVAETEALNELLEARAAAGAAPVEVTLLPFARAMTILAEVLEAGERCPDLVRIDATWLPGLARLKLLRPAPSEALERRDWLPEAEELARHAEVIYALPQVIDGLALIHREGAFRGAALPWPPASLDELELAVSRLRREDQHGLGLRADGYWYVAFLRGLGGEFPEPGAEARGGETTEVALRIDEPVAEEALGRMSELFHSGIAAPPAPGGEQARELARLFRDRRVAVVLEGPWLARELAGDEGVASLGVTPFPAGPAGAAAPRGAQLLAVPTCAAAPDEAWKLAYELTDPELQAAWARAFGTVPATGAALEEAGALSQAFYRALAQAAPLPQHPVTAELFDDLTPAVRAAVLGDATAAEALAGVERGWRRLLERHQLQVAVPAGDRDEGFEQP
jgi:ABC-type glycerol-3-phosphate transport system substrate-binding protein